MTITAEHWQQALEAMGVRPMTAMDWRDAFAAEIQPEKFSKGMDDVLAMVPQVLHECARLERLEENLSYSADRLMVVWPSRFKTRAMASLFEYQPRKLAEHVYGSRMGNGPEGSGDGWAHRGAGPIMFTGRTAYELLARIAGQDIGMVPHLVRGRHFGLELTRRWWEHEMPDGLLSDQVKVRRRVNGGAIGLEHCLQLADSCRRAFA